MFEYAKVEETLTTVKHRACGNTHFECRCGVYTMPFGKYKGKMLSTIYFEDRGKQYLEWCVDNLDPGRTRDYVESFLVMREVNG